MGDSELVSPKKKITCGDFLKRPKLFTLVINLEKKLLF